MDIFDKKEPENEEQKLKGKLSWKVIRTIVKTVLVEYKHGDIVNRVVLPIKAIQDTVTDNVLFSGIQYGLSWARIIKGADTKIENELRAAGIYTKEDFIKLHHSARGVLKMHKLEYGEALKNINKKDGGKSND